MDPYSDSLAAALLDVMPLGVDIVDAKGTVLFLSRAQERQLGADAMGRKCCDVYRDDRTQCSYCPLRNGVGQSETTVLVSEGVLGGRTFQIHHTGITYEGKAAVLEVFEDITEWRRREVVSRRAIKRLKRTEDELRETGRLLEQAQRVARLGWSGYRGADAAERGALDPAIPLVRKPWDLTEFLVTVRRTLDM